MERELVRWLPYFLLGMFVLGLLLFLFALYQLRLRRTGSYWRLRRRAGDRGGRLFVLSVFLMAASVVLTLISGLGALAFKNVSTLLNRGSDNLYGIVLPPALGLTATRVAVADAFTATHEATEERPTATPSPTPSHVPVTLLPTFTPTATLTPTASQTATPTIEVGQYLTAIFNATPRAPDADAHLSLDAADDQVSDDGSAPAPKTAFAAGIRRIYLFMSFEHMTNGVAWSRVLLRDGVAVQGNTLLWSLGSDGNSYFFFGKDDGYAAGSYEARLFIGDHEVTSLHFDVQ
jgi:hypothetical protein